MLIQNKQYFFFFIQLHSSENSTSLSIFISHILYYYKSIKYSNVSDNSSRFLMELIKPSFTVFVKSAIFFFLFSLPSDLRTFYPTLCATLVSVWLSHNMCRALFIVTNTEFWHWGQGYIPIRDFLHLIVLFEFGQN